MSADGAFSWYELRTTDVEAARAFYAAVAGWRVDAARDPDAFYAGERRVAGISALPEQARARGAPPHWLGHVRVADVDGSVDRMVDRGAQRLGPARSGAEVAILRDPLGAVVAVSSRPDASDAVAWHELHTTDEARAWSIYADLFGWEASAVLDLGPEIGPYRTFGWRGGERSAGAMASSARAPHIHTHWLFYFDVADLDRALSAARTLGGRVVAQQVHHPSGGRVAYCEDAQGAAFGLREPAPRRVES
jgi:predicted enzyme related to lactoylglutathione lyase